MPRYLLVANTKELKEVEAKAMCAATLHTKVTAVLAWVENFRPSKQLGVSKNNIPVAWRHLLPCLLLLAGFLLLVPAKPARADLILSAPPLESAELGEKAYKPLAEGLSQILHQRVIYKHPKNWRSYEKEMKKDKYDIIFDGPHFAAWRIESLRARPLVKLQGSLRFVLVTLRTEYSVQQPEHLIGLPVCTLPSPNLGALSLFAMFPMPARQPEYRLITHGGFKEVANALQRGECTAAILRSSYYYKKASNEFRDQTRVIKRSTAMTNQGITLSKRIPSNFDKAIAQYLTSKSSAEALQPLLERFTDSHGNFTMSDKSDYEGQNLLHDNVIFGW